MFKIQGLWSAWDQSGVLQSHFHETVVYTQVLGRKDPAASPSPQTLKSEMLKLRVNLEKVVWSSGQRLGLPSGLDRCSEEPRGLMGALLASAEHGVQD